MKLSPDSLLLSPRNNNRDEEFLIHSSPEQEMKKTVIIKLTYFWYYFIYDFILFYLSGRLPNLLLEAGLVWAPVQLWQDLMPLHCEVVRHLPLLTTPVR